MPRERQVSGAFVGAAIGDAMGGPVEQNHAKRIQRLLGYVDSLLPYEEPYTHDGLHTGYTVCGEPGSVTDDTFIRTDFVRYYIETERPRTPEHLAEWLLDNATFENWWSPALENLERLSNEDVDAETVGKTLEKDGISGWWTPIGVRNATNPREAAVECKRLSTLWKAPTQRDLVASVQAGLAEAFRETATYETVVEAMRGVCGPLPQKLIDRAVTIAHDARDFEELRDEFYARALFPEFDSEKDVPRGIDADLPSSHESVPYTDEKYASLYNHEQIPLAVAGFVFAKGDPEESITATVNLGRDCDSTATSVGSWVGALHGETVFPDEWVEPVLRVNESDVDLRGLTARFIRSEVSEMTEDDPSG